MPKPRELGFIKRRSSSSHLYAGREAANRALENSRRLAVEDDGIPSRPSLFASTLSSFGGGPVKRLANQRPLPVTERSKPLDTTRAFSPLPSELLAMIIDELGPSHLLAAWTIMTLNKAIYLALVPDEGLW